MKGPSPKNVAEKWKKLMVLGEQQGAILLSDLALELEMDKRECLEFIQQLFPQGEGLQVYESEGDEWVDINLSALEYMLPLSPGEWLKLNELLLSIDDDNSDFRLLKKKVTENGPIKVIMEMLKHLEAVDEKYTLHQQMLIQQLDKAILDKSYVRAKSTEEKVYHFYPCRIVHIEGQLSLIAEDGNDHCLVITPINELAEVGIVLGGQGGKVSNFEVEEFIAAIRSMNEKETRLILKIHNPQSVNLSPSHHFLGKPCMITNPNGDLIWAAYVEPCHDLFDWLMGLGKNVEILDPIRFKEEYLIYCEEKVRKIA
ncbi:MAG: WYL domain-containing protein [Bacteriovoracaceae bacterium]